MLPGAVGREPPSFQKGEITANSPQEYLSASYRALPSHAILTPTSEGGGGLALFQRPGNLIPMGLAIFPAC